MQWGFPWSCPWGDHDAMFASLEVADMGLGPRVRVVPESGLPQYVRLGVDGLPQGSPVWAQTGAETELLGVWQQPGATGHIVSVFPQGDWATTDIDVSAQSDAFASGRARRIIVEIEPTLSVFSDGRQLTGWSLTGLRRFVNCGPVDASPHWARLRWYLTDAAGVRSLSIYNGSTTVASGNLTGDGTLTLAAVASGVAGSVGVTYTGTGSGNVHVCWPASYDVYWKTGSGFTGADFPRTADATVYDDGQGNTHWFMSNVLPAATYYVVVHQTDEAGNESTGLTGGGEAVTVYGPPAAPTGLAYVTGDASATQVTFSGGSGATGYLLYDSHSGVFDMDAPTTTLSTSGTVTLSGITTGYSGYRYVIVRSTLGGADDGNSDQLRIEYSGGAVVLPRPPVPGMGTPRVSGRTVIIPCTVSLAEYDALPTTVELFAWEISSGSFNSGSPLSTGVIVTGSMRAGSEIVISVSGTAAADGMFYYLVRAGSANGTYSANSEYAGPVRLTTTAPSQPADITAKSA